LQDTLVLGNLEAKRDWGHARDYVEMQWLMLQQDKPEDFVIATGVQYSVKDFVLAVADQLEMKLRWEGQGVSERAFWINAPEPKPPIIRVDAKYYRATEVETLLGDAKNARNKLGWEAKTSFTELVREMTEADLELAGREQFLKHNDYNFKS
jgi:GDPmannose 4,6-dehydratase